MTKQLSAKQPMLFSELNEQSRSTVNQFCSRCQREWYPNQLIVVESRIPGHKGFTVSCPSCYAVIEQRRESTAKLNRECRQLVMTSKVKGTLIDEAFDKLIDFSLKPSKGPWEWFELTCPKLAAGIENQITDSKRLRELSRLKRQATRLFRALKPGELDEIAQARREFAQEMRQFCKRMGLS